MARLRIVHLVVVIAVFETLVQASYYLDDTDSSITYEGYWVPAKGSVIDRTKLYNGTVMYGQLDSEYTHCTMTIPFNGSGITLYNMIPNPQLLFNVSIDGGPRTFHHFTGIAYCCDSTYQPFYNYTVYTVASLPLGYHTLLLTLLNAYPDNATTNTIWIDYAFVDTSEPTVSTSDAHPSTTSSSAKSKSRSVIGPAIGGTVGGILAITIAILVLFWKRRKTRRGDATLIDPDANMNIPVSNVDRRPVVGGSYDSDPSIEVNPSRIPIVYPSSNVSPSIQNTISPNLAESPPQSRLTSEFQPHSSPTVSSTLPPPVSTLLPSTNRVSKVNDVILTPPDPSTTSDGALAAQEARFLRHLYDRNAPAEEIAELMQAMQMRAREGNDAGMVVSNAEHPDIAPPAYDSEVMR